MVGLKTDARERRLCNTNCCTRVMSHGSARTKSAACSMYWLAFLGMASAARIVGINVLLRRQDVMGMDNGENADGIWDHGRILKEVLLRQF